MRKNLLLSAWAEGQDVGPRATDIMSGVLIVFVFINELPKVELLILTREAITLNSKF